MIKNLLTPLSILNKEVHETPYIIFLEDFPSFDILLKYRHEIRDLKLVPIKTDEMHKKYHSYDKNALLATIDFSKSSILYMPNQFPYMLPSDVCQNLVWIKEGTPENEVITFLEEKIKEINKEVILFERPNNIKTKLVKGSFPYIRHIHFWFKK